MLVLACGTPKREFASGGAGTAGGSGEAGGSGDSGSGGSVGGNGGTSGTAAESGGGSSASGAAGSGENPDEPCAVDPCINGGVCSAEGDKAVCTCSAAYEGEHCEKNVDDCAVNPCQNAGTCIDGTDGYTCSCSTGFSGENCERAVSGCADDPCLNGATCMDQPGSYKCTCSSGFSGTNCELNIDDCAASPCKNGAACVDGVNTYTCQCKPGYSGTTCQTNVDECAPNPCQNGATCTDGVNAFTCQCKAGFTGATCQTNIDDCAGAPCQNGGMCMDGVNTHTCTCTNRYTGANCEYLEVKLAPDDLGGAGASTKAAALSNDGKVLLINYTVGTETGMGRLVELDATNVVTLLSPLSNGWGYGIDKDGATLVGRALSSDDDVIHAIKRVGNSATVLDLSPLGYVGAESQAMAVSADGTTTVGRILPGSSIVVGFYCKAGAACKQVSVDGPSWRQIHPLSVNGDGTVVVGYTFPLDLAEAGAAFRWVTSSAKGTPLSVGAATWTAATGEGVSRDGKVVVGTATINGVSHAVRWTGAAFTPADLGTGRAKATSADGSVTVGVDNSNVPLVWFGTTRKTLASVLGTNPDLSAATLTDLVAVSDDGKVVGGTAKVGGVEHAFMARLP